MKKYIKIIIIISIAFQLNCSKNKNSSKAVTVSILPQKFFIEQIVGNNYTVNVMIPPGHNPASYEPTIQQLQKVSNSVLYFRIGHIPFEITNMDKLTSFNSNMKVIDTSIGIDMIKGHSHDDNTGTDPHIWMSPKASKTICRNILEAFVSFDAQNSKIYLSNYHTLMAKIDDLDKEIQEELKGIKKRKFFTYHPIWGYFSRDYGFEQIPIEFEGKEPTISHIQKIIKIARSENINTIFIQKQFNKTGAEAIAKDINGKVIVLDPLDEKWLNNMKYIAKILKEELDK